ncbi:hypothetical protein [Rhizobium laguerreae]
MSRLILFPNDKSRGLLFDIRIRSELAIDMPQWSCGCFGYWISTLAGNRILIGRNDWADWS